MTRQFVIVLLLLAGAALWWLLGDNPWERTHLPMPGKMQLVLLGGLLLAGAFPAVHRRMFAAIARVRQPSVGARRWTMLAVALVTFGYLAFTAFHQHRVLGPQWHDEHSYLIQMQMLAHGRLWMERHPIGDFFESFHMIVDPVYASKYFPGASILMLPTVLFHLPFWMMPVTLSALALMMVYRVIAELIDGAAGILAVLALISLQKFRMASTMTLSQIPMLLAGMLLVWAWLCWRKNKRGGWAVMIGLLGGLALLTRSLDTLCYALPIGVAILFGLARVPMRRRVTTILLLIAGATPFVVLQLAFDKGVTGKITTTPWSLYSKQSDPLDTIGKPRLDPANPPSAQPQKVAFREQRSGVAVAVKNRLGLVRSWLHWRTGLVLKFVLPASVLIIFLPLAFIGLSDCRRLVLALTLPLMILAYSFYSFFSEYYFVTVAPAAIMLVLLGMNQIENAWPRWRSIFAPLLALMLIAFSLGNLPEISGSRDEWWRGDILLTANTAIAKLDQKPSVVLFKYDGSRRIDAEPVYNIDVAWPDDALVIRANDKGPENIRIYRYYAAKQPARAFYRFDEATGTMEYLGSAKELAGG